MVTLLSVTQVSDSAGSDAALRETAVRLRVGIGAFKRRTQLTVAEGDLTAPQLMALSRLDRFGPATTAELARQEQITPQAMGATVASLEELGLVVRSPDTADGRRSLLSLTANGRTAISTGRGVVADKIAAALAKSFTPEEIATLDEAAILIQRLARLV